MFCEAFPASITTHTHTHTSADPRPGEKEETFLLALRNSSQQPLIKNWTFLCFFWAVSSYWWMLLPRKCSLKCFSSSWCSQSPDWVMESFMWCTVCSFIIMQMTSYLCFAECVCACGVYVFFFFFLCARMCFSVWWRLTDCPPHVLESCFFPPSQGDKTAFLWSYKQFRCIDVPSMHLPLCMWWLLKRSSALSIQEPVK